MVPLSQLQPKAPGAGPDPFAILSKVQQASGGVKFGANAVVTNVQAVSQTDQDAAALAAVLKSLPSIGQIYGSGERTGAGRLALLQSLNVTADGPVTKISLSVPESQIEQMIRRTTPSETQAAWSGRDPCVRRGDAADATAERPCRRLVMPLRSAFAWGATCKRPS
jgi:hypothetical protein